MVWPYYNYYVKRLNVANIEWISRNLSITILFQKWIISPCYPSLLITAVVWLAATDQSFQFETSEVFQRRSSLLKSPNFEIPSYYINKFDKKLNIKTSIAKYLNEIDFEILQRHFLRE